MQMFPDFIATINIEIDNIIKQYSNIPAHDIAKQFNVNMNSKNAYSLLSKKIIEYNNLESFLSLFEDYDFCFKSIKINRFGQLKESISLPVFKYNDIIEETWETSTLRLFFQSKVLLISVFKTFEREEYLNKIVVWKMPTNVLEESVKLVWLRTIEALVNGTIVKYIDKNGKYFSNFPSGSENPYVHVRPHARNRQDTYPLPNPDRLTGLFQYPKHSFWINRGYVAKIIS